MIRKIALTLCLTLLAVPAFSQQSAGPDASRDKLFPFVGVLTGDEINLRAGQSTNFETLKQLALGENVVVVAENFNWYEVWLPRDATCFISADFVKDLGEAVGEITGDRINVRAGPGTQHSVIGQVSSGDLVQIVRLVKTESGEQWMQIEPPQNATGWVAAQFIKFQSLDIPEPHVVARPIRNIYKQRRVAETQAEPGISQPPPFSVTGRLQSLSGAGMTATVRHSVTGADGKAYRLKSFRSLLDPFLGSQVRIEGKLQPDAAAAPDAPPVVLVTKVTYVL